MERAKKLVGNFSQKVFQIAYWNWSRIIAVKAFQTETEQRFENTEKWSNLTENIRF